MRLQWEPVKACVPMSKLVLQEVVHTLLGIPQSPNLPKFLLEENHMVRPSYQGQRSLGRRSDGALFGARVDRCATEGLWDPNDTVGSLP